MGEKLIDLSLINKISHDLIIKNLCQNEVNNKDKIFQMLYIKKIKLKSAKKILSFPKVL